MLKIRIESIYGLPLAKMAMDTNEFQVVTPTEEQIKYLGIEDKVSTFDVQIVDAEDMSSIVVKGNNESVNKVVKMLIQQLPDAFVQKHNLEVYAIFNGRVKHVNPRKKLAIVDLGNGHDGIMFTTGLERGDEIIVQIKELTTEEEKLPLVSETIHLSGEYIVLEKDQDFVRVSRKIQGEDREKLHEIGKKIKPYGFGVILRTSALEANEETLKEEADKLVKTWEKIETEADRIGRPGLVYSGQHMANVSFSYLSKKKLEKIRAEITPTFPDYYVFKSYSKSASFATEVLNNLVDKVSLSDLSSALRAVMVGKAYVPQHYLRILLKLPDMNVETKALGNISEINNIIVTRREVSLRESEEFASYNVRTGFSVKTITAIGSYTVHEQFISPQGKIVYDRVLITAPIDYAYRGKLQAHWIGFEVNRLDGETWLKEDDNVEDWIKSGRVSQKFVDTQRKIMERVHQKLSEGGKAPIVIIYRDSS